MALNYLSGFWNHHSSEAVPGALPPDQNSPQKAPKGLYAEQISGSSFTAPRAENLKTWVYRLRPSVRHGAGWTALKVKNYFGRFGETPVDPEQRRWNPLAKPKTKVDFLDGLFTVAGYGGPDTQTGLAAHLYAATAPMTDRFFYNADAEMMIVPEEGSIRVRTELGVLEVAPLEICVVPKGFRFAVDPAGASARGYVCENFGQSFRLPELGPLGANALANARHFLAPTAAFEERNGKFEIVAKFQGEFWSAKIAHSPLDVVAWHGNFAPYKYDLRLFNTVNTVSFDHPDPSIFTVLTSPSGQSGTANADFVIFPPRWMVAEHTFRPPYFHRNTMSEFMGLIQGAYDAKADGFLPGGASLHNSMSGHGPDADTFKSASKTELRPRKIEGSMAFMWESRYVLRPAPQALKAPLLQRDYVECWDGLEPQFKR